ncbi:hypothetical protein F5Y06DRAFT_255770 [Hypoxylon sp. FL0890]|nr:hypothetical protein F5Y06DRAFT_255770 [Hypoxylon sp. FL0890]
MRRCRSSRSCGVPTKTTRISTVGGSALLLRGIAASWRGLLWFQPALKQADGYHCNNTATYLYYLYYIFKVGLPIAQQPVHRECSSTPTDIYLASYNSHAIGRLASLINLETELDADLLIYVSLDYLTASNAQYRNELTPNLTLSSADPHP